MEIVIILYYYYYYLSDEIIIDAHVFQLQLAAAEYSLRLNERGRERERERGCIQKVKLRARKRNRVEGSGREPREKERVEVEVKQKAVNCFFFRSAPTMPSRRRTLLKVIILGDSGFVSLFPLRFPRVSAEYSTDLFTSHAFQWYSHLIQLCFHSFRSISLIPLENFVSFCWSSFIAVCLNSINDVLQTRDWNVVYNYYCFCLDHKNHS